MFKLNNHHNHKTAGIFRRNIIRQLITTSLTCLLILVAMPVAHTQNDWNLNLSETEPQSQEVEKNHEQKPARHYVEKSSDNQINWDLNNGLVLVLTAELPDGTNESKLYIDIEEKNKHSSTVNEHIYKVELLQEQAENMDKPIAEYRLIERTFRNLDLAKGRTFFLEVDAEASFNLYNEITTEAEHRMQHTSIEEFIELDDHLNFIGDTFHYRNRDTFKSLHERISTIDSQLIANESHGLLGKTEIQLQHNDGLNLFLANVKNMDFQDFTDTCIDTLKTSMDYHNHLEWYTREGSYRQTPVSYLENQQNNDPGSTHNINLQSSAPLLLSDYSQYENNSFFNLILADSAHTLMESMNSSGFFNTEVTADYLNRSYGIGSGFIDTRMSADASIFLANAGIHLGVPQWIEASTNYMAYFNKMWTRGIYHDLTVNNASKNDQNANFRKVLFPDYYHPEQNNSQIPVASLNHTVHNINYLFHLLSVNDLLEGSSDQFSELDSNLIPKGQVLDLLEQLLRGLTASGDQWITDSGDLYYGYSDDREFYGDDYPYITYRDLKVLQSHLESRDLSNLVLDRTGLSATVNNLFSQKHRFLQNYDEHYFGAIYEDDLSDEMITKYLQNERVYNSPEPRYGRVFLNLPLDIAWKDDPKFYALGRYIWLTGATEIKTVDGENKKELSPEHVYKFKITETSLNRVQ